MDKILFIAIALLLASGLTVSAAQPEPKRAQSEQQLSIDQKKNVQEDAHYRHYRRNYWRHYYYYDQDEQLDD